MLIQSFALPILIAGLFFNIILLLVALLACRLLQEMPNNGRESENAGKSWTGPVRTSYIVVAVSLSLLAVSAYLLASTDKTLIIMGIGLITFSVMIAATTPMIAVIVMDKRRQLLKPSPQILADPQKSALSFFEAKVIDQIEFS